LGITKGENLWVTGTGHKGVNFHFNQVGLYKMSRQHVSDPETRFW
jgi:hypothetical protein